MKKSLFVLTSAMMLMTSGNVLAQQEMGGYTGPSVEKTNVADALNLGDDKAVVLEGKIVKNLGDEKYMFADDTGSVTVEIDNEDWRGVSVNENDTVELKGETDKDLMNLEIDVDSVTKK